jgi:hypothetical protein
MWTSCYGSILCGVVRQLNACVGAHYHPINYYINKKGRIMREAYKIQNVNNSISKVGLIRVYKDLLSKKKIKIDGPAHRRLQRLMNEENWWDKL